MGGMLDQLTERRNLYAACERVRNNGGCRGADGITVDHFDEYLEEEIDRLQDRLLRRVYPSVSATSHRHSEADLRDAPPFDPHRP